MINIATPFLQRHGLNMCLARVATSVSITQQNQQQQQQNAQQVRYMGTRRGPMTSKRSRFFYKGNRIGNRGHFNHKQRFVYDETRDPFYVVPDLTDCPFKPYVARISASTIPTSDEKYKRNLPFTYEDRKAAGALSRREYKLRHE